MVEIVRAYKTRGGRIVSLTDKQFFSLRNRDGKDAYILATDDDINEYANYFKSNPSILSVYYPFWENFLMYDGYGYIDYQYRTYGQKFGFKLDTEIKPEHKFALVHHNPGTIPRVRKNWDKPVVVYTMWETDKFPDRHFDAINNTADFVIVPSNFCKYTLINQGLKKPIFVCNQGVDKKHYYYQERELKDEFHFLHNATGNPRKGWEYVIQAFAEEFKNEPNVKLTMKGILKHKDSNHNVFPLYVPFWSTPNVRWVDKTLDRRETLEMYKNHHCLVFPTKGEGWGLVPHEAIMTGLPTITTKGHAIDDYWADGMIAVEASKQPSKYVPVPPLVEFQDPEAETWKNSGQWLETDVNDLRKKMRAVYENWETYKNEAKKGSEYLTQNFDEVAMCTRLANILKEINKQI